MIVSRWQKKGRGGKITGVGSLDVSEASRKEDTSVGGFGLNSSGNRYGARPRMQTSLHHDVVATHVQENTKHILHFLAVRTAK